MQRREFIKWMGVVGGGAYLTRLGGLANPDVYAAAAKTYEKIIEHSFTGTSVYSHNWIDRNRILPYL
mgnify:CR=1 FL=1